MDKSFCANVVCGNLCNNKCSVCKQEKCGNKSLRQIEQELDQLKKDGVEHIELCGGEILIREDVWNLIELIKKKEFFRFSIYTNGRILYYQDFVDKIIKAGVTNLNIKIFGADEITWESITGSRSSYHQTIKGIENLQNKGFKREDFHLELSLAVTKQNYSETAKILKMFLRGLAFVINLYFVEDFFENVKQLEEYLLLLLEHVKQNEAWINIVNHEELSLFNKISPEIMQQIRPLMFNPKFCKYPSW